jgi:hypothetical protein
VTVQLRDSDGTVRLSGDLLATGGATGDVLTQQADGTYAPDTPGGGSASREDFVAGADSTIANNGNDRLNWLKVLGTTLLDLTDPSIPVAIAGGEYAVSVGVLVNTNMTADGFYTVILELDSDGDQASVKTDSRLATAAQPRPNVAIAGTYVVPTGGTFRVKVFNFDGANAIDFALSSAFLTYRP